MSDARRETQRLRQELVGHIKGERTLFVAGTGVSIHATQQASTSSWAGLIKDGLAYCAEIKPKAADWPTRYGQVLANRACEASELIAIASLVETGLAENNRRGGNWSGWLRRTLSQLKKSDDTLVTALHTLGRGRLATCNYDDILTSDDYPPVPYTNVGGVIRVLNREERGVIHLHGHWKTPESVVLGYASYAALLSNDAAQSLQQSFASLSSLVFVGFGAGLEDPNFGALLAWMGKTFAEREAHHFWLVKDDDIERAHAMLPKDCRVAVLGYGRGHDSLGKFLGELIDDAGLDSSRSESFAGPRRRSSSLVSDNSRPSLQSSLPPTVGSLARPTPRVNGWRKLSVGILFLIVALGGGWMLTRDSAKSRTVSEERDSVLGMLPALLDVRVQGKAVGWLVLQPAQARAISATYWDGDPHYAHLIPRDRSLGSSGQFGPPHGTYYVVHNYGKRDLSHVKARVTTTCSLAVAEERGGAKVRAKPPSDLRRWGAGSTAEHLIANQMWQAPGLAPIVDDAIIVTIASLPAGGEIVFARGGPCRGGRTQITATGVVTQHPPPENLELVGSDQGTEVLEAEGKNVVFEIGRKASDERLRNDLIAYVGQTRSRLAQIALSQGLADTREEQFGKALCTIAGGPRSPGGVDDRWVRLVAVSALGPWYKPWLNCVKGAARVEPTVLEILTPRAGAEDYRDPAALALLLELMTEERDAEKLKSLLRVATTAFGDAAWCGRLFPPLIEELARNQSSDYWRRVHAFAELLATGVNCNALPPDRKLVMERELCLACADDLVMSDSSPRDGCRGPFEKLREGYAGHFESYLLRCFDSLGQDDARGPNDLERRLRVAKSLPGKLADERWVGVGKRWLAAGFADGVEKELEIALAVVGAVKPELARELLRDSWRQEWFEQPELAKTYLSRASQAGLKLPKHQVLKLLSRVPEASRSNLLELVRKEELTVAELYDLWRTGEQSAFSPLRERLKWNAADKAAVAARLERDLKTPSPSTEPQQGHDLAWNLLKELAEHRWCALRAEILRGTNTNARIETLRAAAPCLLDGVLALTADSSSAVRTASLSALGVLLSQRKDNRLEPGVAASMPRIIDAGVRLANDTDPKVQATAISLLCAGSVSGAHFSAFLTSLANDKGKKAQAFSCVERYPHWTAIETNPELLALWRDTVPGVLRAAMTVPGADACAAAARFAAEHCVKAILQPLREAGRGEGRCADTAKQSLEKLGACNRRR